MNDLASDPMTGPHDGLDAFAAEVSRYLDGLCTDAEAEALARRLRASETHRRVYVAVCLQARLARETLPEHIATRDDRDAAEVLAVDDQTVEPLARVAPAPRRNWGGALAVAAGLLIAAAAGVGLWSAWQNAGAAGDDEAPVAAHVGVVIGSTDAVTTTEPLMTGATVDAGAIGLAGGSLDLELTSGVALTLAGPTDMTLNSDMRAALRRGLLVAEVPTAAKGFAVDVPGGGRIIDLGTRFAVLVDDRGRTTMYVLEGEVEYTGPERAATPVKRLKLAAGQGLELNDRGAAELTNAAPPALARELRLIEIAPVRTWGADHAEHTPAANVFTTASDGDGLTIEAAFRAPDPSAWTDTHIWSIFRREAPHRVLLALQTSRHMGELYGPAIGDPSHGGLAFGLVNGDYTELDVALDGRGGRPTIASLMDGGVHHVAAVYDRAGGEKRLYLDGVLIGVESLATRPPATFVPGSPVHIGAHGGKETFGGELLGVALYDGPMSRRQVERHAERWLAGERPWPRENEKSPAPADPADIADDAGPASDTP